MDYLFSVIIPTFRDNKRLNICLSALLNQSLEKKFFEVIVINNDPNELIYLHPKYFINLNLKVLNEAYPGSYAARNLGIRFSKGWILAFTDSDCIPDKKWLENSLNYFNNDIERKIGILAGDVQLFYINPNKLSSAEIYEKFTGFTQEQYSKEGNCVTANWFSYKSVFSDVGEFNPKLKSNGDTELSNLIFKKYKVIFAPDVIVRHPARYFIKDLVLRYRRLLGGTYTRRFHHKPFLFFGHIFDFSWRKLRFAIKKLYTVKPYESIRIQKVCILLIIGAWKEYFHLLRNGDTKR